MIQTIRYPEDAGKKFEMFRYPGGEVQVHLLPPFPTEDRVHVIARVRDGEIMGLAALTDALDRTTEADKTLILPYLPYSRADRSFAEGDCCGLETFANLVNSLMYERVVTLDAHSAGASKIMNLIEVSPRPIIDSVVADIPEPFVGILLPDAGASRYGIETSLHASKKRDTKTGRLSGFTIPSRDAFEGLNAVLIVDDICDGGGTFVGIAEQIQCQLNLPLYLYVTHGIFSQGLETLHSYFRRIYTTDSFGRTPPDRLGVLTTIPCMGTILADISEPSALWEAAQ